MTDQEEYQKKMTQCTTWLQERVSLLADPITVAEDRYKMFTWKIYSGDTPSFLCDLVISPTNFTAPEKVRREALWTQLKNILYLRGVDTTPMGIAYRE
jgi:hypothetical protein